MDSSEASTRVIVIALFANLGIAVAKFVGAFFSGSAALLAEAIHSVVDCSNQVLLLVGSKKAKKPPSFTHPLGYGREAFFWSFMVAILLFSLGGLFAIYEGVHKLNSRETVTMPLLGLSILVVAIGLETYSFIACVKVVRAQNTFGSIWKWFQRTTSSELLVIFTEDAAALLGLIIAAVSLLLSWLTHNPVWDAVGSIAIGSLLVIVAVFLAVEIKSLIIGEAPVTDFRTFINRRLEHYMPGAKIFHLIAIQVGVGEVMLAYKVSTGDAKEVHKLLESLNAVERDVKKNFPEVRWQFIEPDSAD